ncbi:alpha/beta fold hydrolase [Pseudonocardia sp. ICBG1142]|uniref:alpha/beta fold hydrolase n=1 Tax=Pseudonocardia sp. ICBG1142 TaxID=2846760 RepID=UPI001CF6F226|nr:alpha/beta fold hydrolase [Pseudonocardia sp. ICBG1142]
MLLDVPGARIAWTDTGPPPGRPDAPTMVLGHGLLFGGWMFRHQIAALRDHLRCVTLDWRGQGDSPPAAGPCDMDTLTADAVALIRHLDVGPVHWVGLSMGGFVGLRLAARHPELVRTLALLDTSADGTDPGAARRQRRLALVQLAVGLRPLAGHIGPSLFGPGFLADPGSAPVLREWLRRAGRTDRWALRRAVLAVAGRDPVSAELGAITAPTVVVVGSEDAATPPDHAARLAAGIRGARLVELAGCGHSSPLERPAEVTAVLAELAAVRPRPPLPSRPG